MNGKVVWKWAALIAVTASAGCCHWCENHCPRPTTACQPCTPCCPTPAATSFSPVAAPAANCQPCVPCCPQPAGYTPAAQGTGWQRNPQTGCCP